MMTRLTFEWWQHRGFICIKYLSHHSICNGFTHTYFKCIMHYFKQWKNARAAFLNSNICLWSWTVIHNVPLLRETSGIEGKQNWLVSRGTLRKCFVIFLDFHFNSNKRITGANQNSRLGTYNNTNLILKTTEWMIYKVLSLYYLHLFPPLAAVSLLG